MKQFALFLALTALAQAQEFEVASVRPATDDAHHSSDVDNGRYRVHNLTLRGLVAAAWDLDQSEVIGGPTWVNSASWDINAKIPAEFAKKRTQDQFRHMVQQLLADRFKLGIANRARLQDMHWL